MKSLSERWPDFKPSEFERADPSCSIEQMDMAFMDRLQTARTLAGVPFHINCAFRSVEHDLARGRSGNSYHTKGRAVDIRCLDSHFRYRIVECLIVAGFRGIGISNRFIHVDDRDQFLIWLY